MRFFITCITIVVTISKVFALEDTVNVQVDDILMLPNERTTLDDCHLRFHKFDPLHRPKPAFGHPARLKEFAHMGAIGWIQPDGRTLWQCGGTLIWYDFVLTAAHCVVDARDQPPNVVRFGDLDLSSTKDDQYAQQLKIVGIYRHPEHRFRAHYHDMALLKLEKSVTLHDTVSPACLWNDDEVRFRALEATGWGKTGFAEGQTPILLKVTLKPITNQQCGNVYSNETNRKLTKGLADEHICAVDEKMDTCDGDSGGPLQIKLLHNSRVSSFIVGVTSFGVPCGTGSPGVYTRVAPYYDWIIDTMNRAGANVTANSMNATHCALRFVKYREYEDRIITSRTEDYVAVNSDLSHMFIANGLPTFVVKLGWTSNGHTNCFGVLIDEDTALTVAHCATYNGVLVQFITYRDDKRMDVKTVHVHPGFKQGNAYNDIAIVRLKRLIDLNVFEPTCIWHGRNVPNIMDVYGIGRRDINDFYWPDKENQLDSTQSLLRPIAILRNSTNCVISEQFKSRLPHGLASEHICTGSDIFLVPKSCDILLGGPLEGILVRKESTYPITYGLTQFGRDCGFGEHSVATGFVNHLDWMKSVLLPNYQTTSDVVQFIDSDRQEGELCSDSAGRKGRCVSAAFCSLEWKKLVAVGEVEFCSSTSVICCPFEQIKDGIRRENPRLVNCPKLVQDLNATMPSGSLAYIGWVTLQSSFEYRCLGSIITSRIVLTTASCLGPYIPHMVQPVAQSTEPQRYEVDAILTHFAYNPADHSNDIALVRVQRQFVWSSQLFPSCLWLNTTHSPLVVNAITPNDDGRVVSTTGITMYNTDCQRFHRYRLHGSQICARGAGSNLTCGSATDQLRYDEMKNGKFSVSYVVGLGMSLEGCDNLHYRLHTRVSSFIDWIGANV